MVDAFVTGPSFDIVVLRWIGILTLLLAMQSFVRHELAGLMRQGSSWFQSQANLCRSETGYVGGLLGRYSLLLAACSLNFAVFRPQYFTNEAAQNLAVVLATVATLLGLLIGMAMLRITSAIIGRSMRG